MDSDDRDDASLTSTMGASSSTPTDAVPSSSSDEPQNPPQQQQQQKDTGDGDAQPSAAGKCDPISSTSDEVDRATSRAIDKEDYMFANEYNLSAPTGKITENVEDIVSDLESLLENPMSEFEVKEKTGEALQDDAAKESDIDDPEIQIQDSESHHVHAEHEKLIGAVSAKEDTSNEEVEKDSEPTEAAVSSSDIAEEPAQKVAPARAVLESSLMNHEKEMLLNEGKELKEKEQQAFRKLYENMLQMKRPESSDSEQEEEPQIEETVETNSESAPIVEGSNSESTPIVEETNSELTPIVEESNFESIPILEETNSESTPMLQETIEEADSESKDEATIETEEEEIQAEQPVVESTVEETNIPEVEAPAKESDNSDCTNESDVPMDITPSIETSMIIEPVFPAVVESSTPEKDADEPQPIDKSDEKDEESMEIDEEVVGKIEISKINEAEVDISRNLESQKEAALSVSVAEHELEPLTEVLVPELEPEPEVDHEAELVRAAIEASAFRQAPPKQLQPEPVAVITPVVNDDDVILAAMEAARNDEEDLIKAALECQERDVQEEQEEEPLAPPVVVQEITQNEQEPEVASSTQSPTAISQSAPILSDRKRPSLEELKQKSSMDYQKPLNIVVEAKAESTTIINSSLNDPEKESSDEDKQEYSSKFSQNEELKLTIRKNKAEESSILKIYDPKEPPIEISPSESETDPETNECPLPKLVIKQSQLSPKVLSPFKITLKPVGGPKSDEGQQKSSPKLIIKPIVKPDEEMHHSPKITIKPIPKPDDHHERCNSPKITIKPLVKPTEACVSPKIKIKPIVRPDEEEERIVLKISKPKVVVVEEEKEKEKLGKIKLKFSMEGGHAHIVNQEPEKRSADHLDELPMDNKRLKLSLSQTTDSSINDSSSSLMDTSSMLTDSEVSPEKPVVVVAPQPKRRGRPRKVPLEVRPEDPDEPVIVEPSMPSSGRGRRRKTPLKMRHAEMDESLIIDAELGGDATAVPVDIDPAATPDAQTDHRSTRPKRSCRGPTNVRDTLGMRPLKPASTPRGRSPGRARGGRGRGRGRGGAEARLAKQKEKLAQSKLKLLKEAEITASVDASFGEQQRHYMREELDFSERQTHFVDPQLLPTTAAEAAMEGTPPPPPPSFAAAAHLHHHEQIKLIIEEDARDDDVVMYEEETRMSADSRAQTPAKQIIINPLAAESVGAGAVGEESQSSVQSTATTESGGAGGGKLMKRPKMEIEPESVVISADQLAEYYWGGGGPYMLQEQVAQYLGIKSFKRKYPGIARRPVEMQERDFIRESALASEAMCDLGLTAVASADILDLMYTDFQHKYEEYCKHQRDRQTKDITNKQRALSLAASQEKNKIDIMHQAVESAAQWNASFNKQRREERKACMDLQTFTINYPRGSRRKVDRPKVGDYPVALVPGQYTDYYKAYTPTELNNMPLNTMLYKPINIPTEEDTASSGSESDSSTSGSDSCSDTESSADDEDCNLCSPTSASSGRRVCT